MSAPESAHKWNCGDLGINRYTIEGRGYANLKTLLLEARKRGYDGSEGVFSKRVKKGPMKWSVLAKPVHPNRSEGMKRVNKKTTEDFKKYLETLPKRRY